MKEYCEDPYCENQSVKEAPVSVEKPSDQVMALCAACEEAEHMKVAGSVPTHHEAIQRRE